MDILNGFRRWIVAHWAELESEGNRLTLAGQTPEQTQKTNQMYLYAKEERYEACVILWEFGHCDVTIADLGAKNSVPLEECLSTLHFEGVDSRAKMNAMMEDILTAFRATVSGTADV